MRFTDKCVIVTGASSGMGWSTALGFAAEGATVIAVARRKERLDQLIAEAADLPGKVLAYTGDVSTRETNEAMIEFALEQCGKLDVLVNNAGLMDEFKPVGEVEDDQWNRVFQINVYGPMTAMRKAVQVMGGQKQGGCIVNVASIGGLRGCRAGAAYTASKHALVGLTQNTAYMYQGAKIRCNAVCPGGVDTEVMNGQNNISQLGIGRVMAGLDKAIPSGKPQDIAAVVMFLASDDAKFMNGSAVVVDGGVSCN